MQPKIVPLKAYLGMATAPDAIPTIAPMIAQTVAAMLSGHHIQSPSLRREEPMRRARALRAERGTRSDGSRVKIAKVGFGIDGQSDEARL